MSDMLTDIDVRDTRTFLGAHQNSPITRVDLVRFALRLLPDDSGFLILFGKHQERFPTLSAARIGTTIHLPNDRTALESTVSQFEASTQGGPVYSAHSEYVSLKLLWAKDCAPNEALSHLLDASNATLLSSRAGRNVFHDELSSTLNDFRDAAFANRLSRPDELCARLANDFKCFAYIFDASGKRPNLLAKSPHEPNQILIHTLAHARTETRIRECAATEKVLELPIQHFKLENRIEIGDFNYLTEPNSEHNLYLFPVHGPFHAPYNTQTVALLAPLSTRHRFSVSEVSVIERCIEIYVQQKYRSAKRLLISWQLEKQDKAFSNPISLRSEALDAEYRSYLTHVGREILDSTLAHSFAFLGYSSADSSLCPVVVLEAGPSGGATDVSPAPDEHDARCVPLVRKSEYLSAFTFTNADKLSPQYVYVPNVYKLDPALRILGLKHVTTKRRGVPLSSPDKIAPTKFDWITRAEISVPLLIGGLPFGVVNIESPVVDGLTSDLEFLVDVCRNAAMYRLALQQGVDLSSLGSSLQLQENLHILRKLASEISPPSVQHAVRSLLKEPEPRPNDAILVPASEMRGLVDAVLNHQSGGHTALANRLSQCIKLHINDNFDIDSGTLFCVRHIISNLLKNWQAYQNDATYIAISTRKRWNGASNVVVIRTELDYLGPQSEIEIAFNTPLPREDRTRHGLYIIGLMARSTGGYLTFDRKKDTRRRRIEIIIPGRKLGGWVGV